LARGVSEDEEWIARHARAARSLRELPAWRPVQSGPILVDLRRTRRGAPGVAHWIVRAGPYAAAASVGASVYLAAAARDVLSGVLLAGVGVASAAWWVWRG